MKTILVALTVTLLASPVARAGGTYVLPDGLNRSPAMTLHCVTSGNTVGPCGTSGNPLVTSVAGAGVTALPVGGVLISRTTTLAAGVSTQVFASNPQRRYLAVQVPLSSGVWLNPLGGLAAPNGADCIWFAAGTFYESGGFVNRGAVSVYSPVPVTLSAWEN